MITSSKQKDQPFATFVEYYLKKRDNLPNIMDILGSFANAITSTQNPRTGVLSYSFAASILHPNSRVAYFTEIYNNVEAYVTHLTPDENIGSEELFSPKWATGRVVSGVNIPRWHDGIFASHQSMEASFMDTLDGHVLNPHKKALLGGRFGKLGLPPIKKAFSIDFRIEAQNQQDCQDILNILRPLTIIEKTDIQIVSSFLIHGPGWWRKDPNTSHLKLKTRDIQFEPTCYKSEYGSNNTIQFYMICSTPLSIRHKFSSSLVNSLAALVKKAKNSEFVITAENFDDNEELEALIEYFSDHQLFLTDKRLVHRGYILHPFFTRGWKGSRKPPPLSKPLSSTTTSLDNTTQSNLFTIQRNSVSNKAESIAISSKTPQSRDRILICSLLQVLRKLTGSKQLTNQIDFGLCFGMLERMRSLVRECEFFNLKNSKSIDPHRVDRFIQNVTLMGLDQIELLKPEVKVHFPGLQLLIKSIEAENSQLIQSTRINMKNNGKIDYLGLAELYQIGSHVYSNSFGSLGGILTTFRVVDCYFEPLRSLFGSKKYIFRLKLEVIVPIGGLFVVVVFSHPVSEFEEKSISQLKFLPFSSSANHPNSYISSSQSSQSSQSSMCLSLVQKRISILSQICSKPHFKRYLKGSFIPVLSKNMNSKGAASSSILQNAPGRCMTDSVRGLQLGYSPTNSSDSLGQEVALIMKLLKTNQSENLDFVKLKLKIKQSLGISIFETFPSGYEPWPCIVGFSLTLKVWGSVLVDNLEDIEPNTLAWEQLVLPFKTKETLIALTTPRSKHKYVFHDVIDGKGMGSLYLLYGDPGTGKSLTVESLAQYFGRPLYTISFGELGTSIAELEERLTETLNLASQWNCFVLLDEGDALVEKRSDGQYNLNSMTGVLLRLLENFQGSLFITTNRAAIFDPAALSRVTLAIKYRQIDQKGKRQIWKNTIVRVLQSDSLQQSEQSVEYLEQKVEKEFDLDKLSKFPGSGRSIGAIFRMATILSNFRKIDFTQSVLNQAIDLFNNSLDN